MKHINILYMVILSLSIFYKTGNFSLTKSEETEMLYIHNDNRSTVNPTATNMMRLTWSDKLAALAEKWSSKCIMQHPPDSDQEYAPYGQNIYYASKPKDYKINVGDAVVSWSDEIKEFVYPKTCNGICGHYTQIIWATTTEVGCGKSLCTPSIPGNVEIYIVCQYFLRGNYFGEGPYEQGAPCSKCPETHKFCVKSLCSKTANGGEMTLSKKITSIILSVMILLIYKLNIN